jgi:glycosyltransferase involved in cell wall biosynthesis
MLGRIRRMLAGSEPSPGKRPAPQVSIVVIVYDMPAQAALTLESLKCDYQVGVDESDYEVIVVENGSPNNLPARVIDTLPGNFSYFLREDAEPTPAHAINFGASRARGGHICVMIDGARMLTPGVIRHLLLGHRLFDTAVVSVPGYHLGRELQQEAVNSGYGPDEERELLRSIDWPADGYGLFDIACFSGSCAAGFFLPNSESNCISMPRGIWDQLGGYDTRFDLPGGGFINLDFYKRACELTGVKHVIALGEGSFHQFHGGVTTGGQAAELRDAYLEASKRQYQSLRGEGFSPPDTRPTFLGELPVQVQRFIHYSSQVLVQRRGEPDAGACGQC